MSKPKSFLHDDSKLHKLCQDGNYRKVTEFVSSVSDAKALEDRLANRKGVFGYTPLHEAVASGHHKVLDFLLGRAGDGHVNCRANSGYTPLHLAASSGHGECVRVLLRHNADISVTDEYGKTPKQTAELSSKNSIVLILRSAGEHEYNTGVLYTLDCIYFQFLPSFEQLNWPICVYMHMHIHVLFLYYTRIGTGLVPRLSPCTMI